MEDSGSMVSNWQNAKSVCVIGSGTMGSGIAAHLANIGFEVTMLGIDDQTTEEAIDKLKQTRPPQLYVHETADRIRLGNTTDNLEWAAEADWICEAIVEKLDAKKALFARLDPILPPTAMVSTNTSGLQIGLLSEGLSESFQKRFMGTHFFNPPRYLKLLELIPTEKTDPVAVSAMSQFLENKVARRVVVAKDTPGFIANRFGMWAMIHAIHTAERLSLTVEQVDAITGPFLGRPKSASFRLADLVGLDIMQDIASNLYERCPGDRFRNVLETPSSMTTLLERGWIGEKAGQGYYRREGKELMALELTTLAYRQKSDFEFPSLAALSKLPLGERVRAALELRDEAGEFLRNHLIPVLQYADHLKDEISHSVQDFDRVMMWGFGWEMGPFAMIDAIGHDRIGVAPDSYYQGDKVRISGGTYAAPPAEPQYQPLSAYPIIDSKSTFNLRDLGDGVTAICTTTKLGTINPTMVHELGELLDAGKIGRFVLTSESKSFSAGFDLKYFMERIDALDYDGINSELKELQQLGGKLARIPGVAAVCGYCLGAGLELAINCSTIAASPESQIGFPEAKVGLIPGGAGTALMRIRHQDQGMKTLTEMAMRLTFGQVSTNSDEARHLGFLRSSDIIVYHPDRLIHDAKKLALTAVADTKRAWLPAPGPLGGMIDRELDEKRSRNEITDYDKTIGDKIKLVFSKSDSFETALERERQVFLDLCGRALTHARIKHMLENGKPLRN